MRIRSLKPEFWASFSIAKLSEPAALLAIGLLNHACDRGYFEADPRIIKAWIFPLREPSRSIPGMLSELSEIGYIQLREAPDGRLVGFVTKFSVHQVINKTSKRPSKVCAEWDKCSVAQQFASSHQGEELPGSRSTTGALPEPSGKNPAGTGSREQGAGSSSRPDSAPPPPDQNREKPSDNSEPSAEGQAFVKWFLDLLAETESPTPKLSKSGLDSWAMAYDRMLRLDGRTKDQVKEVCRWARNDSFWRTNFLSPQKLREKKDGVMYFDQFLAKMQGRGSAPQQQNAGKPASLWELEKREEAIKSRMRDLSEGHQGQRYVSMQPGRTSPYEWTEEGKAEYERLQADLAEIRKQKAANPDARKSA